MPPPRAEHHCWCSTKSKPVRAPHGSHHEFCNVHTEHFFRAGRHCILCEEEADLEERRRRKERERERERVRREEVERWFKEGGKGRKGRESDKGGEDRYARGRGENEKHARAKRKKQRKLVILAVDVFVVAWKLGNLVNTIHKELKKELERLAMLVSGE